MRNSLNVFARQEQFGELFRKVPAELSFHKSLSPPPLPAAPPTISSLDNRYDVKEVLGIIGASILVVLERVAPELLLRTDGHFSVNKQKSWMLVNNVLCNAENNLGESGF